MPNLPSQPCRSPRCRKKQKGAYCDEHKPKPIAWKSSANKSPEQRGYGSKWRKIRKLALARDSYLCQSCLAKGITTGAREVDHIKNKANGGDDSLNNLQSLCSSCHREKTIAER